MAKMKTNQEGGAILAKDSGAAGNQLESNQKSEGAGKIRKANSSRPTKGAAKYGHKGAADFPEKGTQEHKASVKHSGSGEHLGAKRMGYNQSFGAARMGGYAKGAAKVANIMSFGASKYMKHGAADTGHGGPEGHTHPTKTITSRDTSGGGSSSSSSNSTGGGSSSSMQSTDNLSNYQAGLRDLGPDFKPTAEQTARANAKVAELKKKDEAAQLLNDANVISSSSSSNNTNAGSSTTTSNTTTSPNSMAETLLQSNIQDENRAQRFNFDRDEANITAANDSISARNTRLNRMPRYNQQTPGGQNAAGRAGSRAAAESRRNSGLFSRDEVISMYRDGQNKE